MGRGRKPKGRAKNKNSACDGTGHLRSWHVAWGRVLGLGIGRTQNKTRQFFNTPASPFLTRSVCRHLRFLGPIEAIAAVGVSGFLSCGDQAAHELSQPCGELVL
jgi:hypothetical protein